MSRAVQALVDFSTRRPWPVIAMALLITMAGLWLLVTRFAINTDTAGLISPNLQWRQVEIDFEKTFPQRVGLVVAVIDAATPEGADAAADRLTADLSALPKLFEGVERPDGGPFFARNGLLFLSPEDLRRNLGRLVEQRELLAIVAGDPSLRGVAQLVSTSVAGVDLGIVKLDELAPLFSGLAAGLERAASGERTPISWTTLLGGG
jgi:hypothetical protein